MDEDLHSAEERDLIERGRAGDAAAATAILQRYAGSLYDFALRTLRDEPAAATATAEALEEALRRFAELPSAAAFRPWLFGLAHRRAVPRAAQAAPTLPTRAVTAALVQPGAGVSAADAATVWAGFATLEPQQYAL